MKDTRTIITKAPTRLDFAGGWTDTPPYSAEKGGSVVNAAINLHMNVRLRLNPEGNAKRITIRSIDYETRVEADEISELALDGEADFMKAALKSLPVTGKMELTTASDTPPGSGLGGSGSLGVAMTKALTVARGDEIDGKGIPEKARDIEVEELKVLGGRQDQYAAMFGGFRYMRFKDPEVEMMPLALLETTVEELRAGSILAYTGKSRSSGRIHQNVVDAYHAGDKNTLRALDAIRDAADNMKDALLANDLTEFARLMNANWKAQKRLHPSITNETIEGAFEVAMKRGALCGKALGAGGGGCIYFFCEAGMKGAVEEAVKNAGCVSLPFDFDFQGLSCEVIA